MLISQYANISVVTKMEFLRQNFRCFLKFIYFPVTFVRIFESELLKIAYFLIQIQFSRSKIALNFLKGFSSLIIKFSSILKNWYSLRICSIFWCLLLKIPTSYLRKNLEYAHWDKGNLSIFTCWNKEFYFCKPC